MAIEVAILLFLGVIGLAVIIVVGGPMTSAIAEKFRYKYKEMGSETETVLRKKIEFLESEMLALKQQVNDLQATVDFVSKQIESQPPAGEVIKLSDKQKQT